MRCCVTQVLRQKDREREVGDGKGHRANQESFLEEVAFQLNSEALEQTEPGEENPKHRMEEVWQKALDCMRKRRSCGIPGSYFPLCQMKRPRVLSGEEGRSPSCHWYVHLWEQRKKI